MKHKPELGFTVTWKALNSDLHIDNELKQRL